MTWTETHRSWQALQEVEALVNEHPAEALPWKAEYADLFGDRAGLLTMLRYRWRNTHEAQLDTRLPAGLYAEHVAQLRERHAPLLGLLRRKGQAELGAQNALPIPA